MGPKMTGFFVVTFKTLNVRAESKPTEDLTRQLAPVEISPYFFKGRR